MSHGSNDFRDTLYTVDKTGNRKWVYPKFIAGRHLYRRAVVAYGLMLIYLIMPWITINGRQGILLDIPRRRFVFFGTEFWATDTILLFLIIAGLAFSLFFFTANLGRVWCGWACPETVFLEFLFRPIERLIEGSDSERRKLDAAPWGLNKLIKKGLKHAFCAAGAWVLASTALAYFIGREPLLKMMSGSPLDNFTPFVLTLILMGFMAFQFGWFREQFCTVVCPYARFQSVLMDPGSLLIGYDKIRGEPRGKHKGKDSSAAGDCVDCGLCVKVCPTGIDIRNGTQLECIACAACADACDSVMVKIGKPAGLIRYSNEATLERKPYKLIRPRIFVYAFILLVISTAFIYSVSNRALTDVEVLRIREAHTFTVDEQGIVTNHFEIRLSNKSGSDKKYVIKVLGETAATLTVPLEIMPVAAEKSARYPLFVKVANKQLHDGSLKIKVLISELGGNFNAEQEINILGPEEDDNDDD